MEHTTLRPSSNFARARETLDQINYSARKYKRPLILLAIGMIALVGMAVSINYCEHKQTITAHLQQGHYESCDRWSIWKYDEVSGKWCRTEIYTKLSSLDLEKVSNIYEFYVDKTLSNKSLLDWIEHHTLAPRSVHFFPSDAYKMDFFQNDQVYLSWGGTRGVWVPTEMDHVSTKTTLKPLAIAGAVSSGVIALGSFCTAINTAKRIAQDKTEVEREEWRHSPYHKLENEENVP